jgi:hypothetical protein
MPIKLFKMAVGTATPAPWRLLQPAIALSVVSSDRTFYARQSSAPLHVGSTQTTDLARPEPNHGSSQDGCKERGRAASSSPSTSSMHSGVVVVRVAVGLRIDAGANAR